MAGDIYFSGRRIARADFNERSRRLASDLKANGVGADDVVAILMRNDVAYLEVVEACRHVGARYAVINWHAAPPEVAYIVEDSGAKALFAHVDLLEPVVQAVPAGVRLIGVDVSDVLAAAYGSAHVEVGEAERMEDLIKAAAPYEGASEKLRGLFAYTSGSTGRPKGIRRKMNPDGPDSYETYAQLARLLLGANEGDRMHIAAPLYHSAPNALAQFVLAAGDIDLFIEPKFDAETFLNAVDEHGVTHAYIVPTMMVRLLKLPEETRAKYGTSSLRFTISTGSPCPAAVKEAMIDWFGPVLNETYGASELGFMTLINAEDALKKRGSVGKVLPGGDVKILDDDMNELPPGEVGRIYIHLPMFGDFEYTNKAGALADQRHGAFTTVGDVGYVDEDGFIYISDRKKDMIISGGANIFPSEIEAELIQMPEVRDCAVFGAPDEEFGERIVAAVQCAPGVSLDLDKVHAFLAPRLAKFKLPRVLDIHEALPREDSGKIFKARLRAPYWEKAGRSI